MAISTIDGTGLTIESQPDIVTDLTTGMQGIYGPDINVNSNSPDGQFINIQAQAMIDLLEFLQAIYASFTTASAYGTQLDNRVAINGIQRIQGTYTVAQVAVTVSQALTLPGLDGDAGTAYFTVADATGNQYQLVSTYSFGSAGTETLAFQAVNIGQLETSPNTIQTIITSTLGVTGVNNPSTSSDVIGVNEETDAQLRVRHDQSFALAATGPADSVAAALLSSPGVIDANAVENYTGSPIPYDSDTYSLPAHFIWCIVNGGTAAAIGQAIYAKKGDGCGMYGALSYVVTRPNGSTFTAKYDIAIAQPLYIKFSIVWRGGVALDNASIISGIVAALSYKMNQNPCIGDVAAALTTVAPTAIMNIGSNQGVSSDGSTYTSIIYPTAPPYYYTLSAANISIT